MKDFIQVPNTDVLIIDLTCDIPIKFAHRLCTESELLKIKTLIDRTLKTYKEFEVNDNYLHDVNLHGSKSKTLNVVNRKRSNAFIPPTEREVIDYCRLKGIKDDTVAKRAFQHYVTGDWKDTTGKKVKNWKQKILTNWINPAIDKQVKANGTQVKIGNLFKDEL